MSNLSRSLQTNRGLEKLEPYEGKLSCTVLRGERDSNVPDLPDKFHGLPGLIMKASDCKGEYLFECIGIDSKGTRPITIYKVPFNRTDRHEYYDARHRYDVNPYAYYEATGGVHVDVVDESGNPSVGAYDPIDLQYDYIETDWRK